MNDPFMRYAELARRVREQIGQAHRYAHVVRTARLAETLARAHGACTRSARLAGMLHDLARLYPGKRLLEECERRGIPRDAFALEHPIVLHAPLSAELAREEFGVTDEAVLSAVAKHTLADAEMSALDAIMYLADALEPGRDYPEREGLLALALRDLDKAMLATLTASCDHLRSLGQTVAPQTLAALAFYTVQNHKGDLTLPDHTALVDLICEAAREKKAEDIVTLPLEGRTVVADYFIVATGRSHVQTRAVADGITERAREAGFPVARREGYGDGGWVLLDLSSVVVHIFTPELRAFYNLERLWGEPEQRARQASIG